MSAMEPTERHLDMLRHMLGINDKFWKRQPEPYRNYAAMNPGDTRMVELESMGLVECYRRSSECREGELFTSYDWFRCTQDGERLARASFMAKRYPRDRRRYHAFLDLSDCCPGLTFHEFLTSPVYAEYRRRA